MERGAWRATVLGVSKSQTRLSTHTHTLTNLAGSLHLNFLSCFLTCRMRIRKVSFPWSLSINEGKALSTMLGT